MNDDIPIKGPATIQPVKPDSRSNFQRELVWWQSNVVLGQALPKKSQVAEIPQAHAWQPIATAPKDNARLLYLAKFDDTGKLLQLDFDGIWEFWQESWEMPHIHGYDWCSANGIEEPTHWAYQDEGPPPPAQLPAEQPWTRNPERTMSLLLLCGGHDVPASAIEAWTDEQCQQAEDWAARSHLHASDNDDVEVPPMPEHVKAHPQAPIIDRPDDISLWGN